MAVIGIDVQARRPLADGQPFGAAGAYERIDGIVRFGVDPTQAANAAIVDLDKAPCDDHGRVTFLADFCVLQPLDASLGSGKLLFEVANRGRRLLPRQINRAPNGEAVSEEIDPGDGFLMRHGWTVA